jgi:hypothetical protein
LETLNHPQEATPLPPTTVYIPGATPPAITPAAQCPRLTNPRHGLVAYTNVSKAHIVVTPRCASLDGPCWFPAAD